MIENILDLIDTTEGKGGVRLTVTIADPDMYNIDVIMEIALSDPDMYTIGASKADELGVRRFIILVDAGYYLINKAEAGELFTSDGIDTCKDECVFAVIGEMAYKPSGCTYNIDGEWSA